MARAIEIYHHQQLIKITMDLNAEPSDPPYSSQMKLPGTRVEAVITNRSLLGNSDSRLSSYTVIWQVKSRSKNIIVLYFTCYCVFWIFHEILCHMNDHNLIVYRLLIRRIRRVPTVVYLAL